MFIIIESSKDLPCRIVDITPVDTPGASLFKPVVIGTTISAPSCRNAASVAPIAGVFYASRSSSNLLSQGAPFVRSHL